MSEVIPSQNSDDVLTLIRRLVVKPPLVLEHPVDIGEGATDAAPLLVLTSALRVEGDCAESITQADPDPSPPIEPLLLVEPILPASPQDQDLSDTVASAMLADLQGEKLGEPMTAAVVDKAAHLGVDPAELRDLVRDLIREELAGALGTRMTRNIRRLVRAEIARELAMRELD